MTVIDNRFYPLQSSMRQVSAMRERFDVLQQQLATGERASTLAELGGDRFFDLTIRSRLAKLEGYESSLTALNLRVDMLGTSLQRLGTLNSDTRGIMGVGGYGQDDLNLGLAPVQAKARLDEVLNLLNAEVGGRYLFGGNRTDAKPVASLGAVLDGEGGRAGFRTVAGEQRLADLGADGRGRLTLGGSGANVTLAEDGPHSFGLKLGAVSYSGSGLAPNQASGDPAVLTLAFSGQPQAGDSVTIGLTLPDGTERAVTLTAGGSGTGGFAVGADVATTASNFAAALGSSLERIGGTELAAASAFVAAENFFNGGGQPVRRVDGPPFETATGLVDATPANTVLWYRGQDSADARGTVAVKIDEGVSIGHGAQANEAGLVDLVRTLAVMTVTDYPADDDSSHGKFDAVAVRQLARLGQANGAGSIQGMAVEIGLAKARAEGIAEAHASYGEQLETLRAGIEGISTEEVAMEILALKTRLEASYQTAALVSQLSLVNYLR